MAKRPNILYLMTDQQKASASSVYGNPRVPSPFMDEMAASGVVFMDAYSPSPICTPARASIFTGVHPLVHQVTCHQNRAPYGLRQLPEFLAEEGYYTAVAGHYEADRNLTRGWHEQVKHDETGALARAFKAWYAHGRQDVGWSSGRLDYEATKGHAACLTDRVIHMLDGIEAADAPFFLHVPYLEPHPPYFVCPPYDTLVDPESLALPDQGTDEGRPVWQKAVQEQLGTAKARDADIRQMIAIYYGMIAYTDAQMRRLYTALAERGLLENTWIIICSDHGDYAGEKGLFMKSESLYECLLHVPLIMVPPPEVRWPRGQRVSGLVDLVDLFPTILSLAGVSIPEYVQGKDLLPWVKSGARTPLRDLLFAQVGGYQGNLKTTAPSGLPESGRRAGLVQGVRSERFSYMRDPDYGDEAYDLRRDPWEVVNLLGREKGAAPPEVSELRRQVDRWEAECISLREALGVIPGYRGFD